MTFLNANLANEADKADFFIKFIRANPLNPPDPRSKARLIFDFQFPNTLNDFENLGSMKTAFDVLHRQTQNHRSSVRASRRRRSR